ncbi:glycosyltransferase, partial [Kineococcus glutinatus]|uniref:glycosyltransferase n=1 Tax=Kineococcus glutinatus TaxID=1070872 RepID=UPI0031E8E1EF
MTPAAAAVVPVRGHGQLLTGCLRALAAQTAGELRVVVVDDSPDGSLVLPPGTAPAGTTVLRSGGRGPYAARNLAAGALDVDVLLFLDARSRPHPGWARALLGLFEDPAVALGGSDVRVCGGPSLAAAASELQQFARLRNYVAANHFMPYLPTCNLAVRRSDFTAVGGFRDVRSGGDADLCWRVLSRPDRRLATVEEVLMDWLPRTSVVELVEQHYRYGRSTFELRRSWQGRGAAVPRPLPYWRLVRRTGWLGVRAGAAWARRDR